MRRYRNEAQQLVADAKAAAQGGFASVWVPKIPAEFDAFKMITLLGRVTERVRLDADPCPAHLLLRLVGTAICASDVHPMDHHDAVPGAANVGVVYDENCDIVLGQEFAGGVIGHDSDCSDQFAFGARMTSMPIRLAVPGFSFPRRPTGGQGGVPSHAAH